MVDLLAMGCRVPYYRVMPSLLNRLVRAAGSAAASVLIGTVLVLGWDWLKIIGPPRPYLRYLAVGFLEIFLAGYFVVGDDRRHFLRRF